MRRSREISRGSRPELSNDHGPIGGGHEDTVPDLEIEFQDGA